MNDPEKLIAAYLDDAITEAEAEALNAWLTADRANLRSFTKALIFDEEIRSAARAHAAQSVAANLARNPEPGATSRPWRAWPQKHRPAWAFAAAAALAVAGAALRLMHPEPQEPTGEPMDVAATSEWAVPSDVLLTEEPAVARLSEEISELLQP